MTQVNRVRVISAIIIFCHLLSISQGTAPPCGSEANEACKERCIHMSQDCFCATNGKTYRNPCEMGCMRKVNTELINFKYFGICEPLCPFQESRKYVHMIKDMLVTEYLKSNVKRCGKLLNCMQANELLRYTFRDGRQSILDCTDQLPVYLLFSDLNCTGYVSDQLKSVFNSGSVINCTTAKRVNKRLFNKIYCARQKHGPNEKTLIQWSFDLLDRDKDLQLTEQELTMSSYIPDQQCGAAFFSNCDKDSDGFIREDEWSVCLGCDDCYRPCNVYKSLRMKSDRSRRFIESIVTCKSDGTCAKKQCELLYNGRHKKCWCVDPRCNKIEGTDSFTVHDCN